MDDTPRVAREIVVSGSVQGVFFRASCQREAVGRGLTGWVRNEPDGSVRIHAEGARDAVEELAAWARQGPPRARVERVAEYDVPLTDASAPSDLTAGDFEVL